MKKVLLVITLILMNLQPLYAVTGNQFVIDWKEWKKSKTTDSCNWFSTGFFSGYVAAIVDTLDNVAFSTPTGSTYGQFCHVVGKWIDDHPERWADSPRDIVIEALREAFPLKKNGK